MTKKILNLKEVRKLAAKIEKNRPILGYAMIKNGVFHFTDGNVLILAGGYEESSDCIINLNDYSVNTDITSYPNLDSIISMGYNEIDYTPEIKDGKLIYKLNNIYGTFYIDSDIKQQLERLINIKGYQIDISTLKVRGSSARFAMPDNDLIIYFTTKRSINDAE